MRMLIATVALAALTQPTAAITFPSLTTIYVGSGVYDDGDDMADGTATVVHCSNVSGQSVQIRALVLSNIGNVEGSSTQSVAHGATVTFATHVVGVYNAIPLLTGEVKQGVVNVEATNSGVFCTAMTINADLLEEVVGVQLHLVRVNPHPGTVE
jgi:hypothetical protein